METPKVKANRFASRPAVARVYLFFFSFTPLYLFLFTPHGTHTNKNCADTDSSPPQEKMAASSNSSNSTRAQRAARRAIECEERYAPRRAEVLAALLAPTTIIVASAVHQKETAEANAKWDWYTEHRNNALLDDNPFQALIEGSPASVGLVPHCGKCAQFVTSRYALSVQNPPHRDRVANEDPPELTFTYATACEHCLERVRGEREWATVTGGKLPDDALPALMKRWGVIEAEHYLECVRQRTPHRFLAHWQCFKEFSYHW